jgi:hypothetical protein
MSTAYYLAFEIPGDGLDAWVTRYDDEPELIFGPPSVSGPMDVHPTLGPDDVDEAKTWAAKEIARWAGVTVTGWSRVPHMDWDTYRAETE